MKKVIMAFLAVAMTGAVFFLGNFGFTNTATQQAQARVDCSTVLGVLPGVVPQPYNSTFTEASAFYKIDPALEAAVFMSEHANVWPEADSPQATSHAGAQGWFQFMPNTWAAYGNSNSDNPVGSPQNLKDSAFAAAHYLKDLGGYVNMPPGDPNNPVKGTVAWAAGSYNGGSPKTDPSQAGYSENHPYMINAVAKYLEFKGGSFEPSDAATEATLPEGQIPNTTCVAMPVNAGSVIELMRNPNITFTHPGPELDDLRTGRISPKLIALLTQIASTHKIGIFALASDHGPGTNHEAGRAADIWIADGDNCYPPDQAGGCWQLAQELDRITGCLHPTELIYYFDPGPSPDSFAKSDHDDHIHVGYDGPLGPKHYDDGLDPCSPKALTGTG